MSIFDTIFFIQNYHSRQRFTAEQIPQNYNMLFSLDKFGIQAYIPHLPDIHQQYDPVQAQTHRAIWTLRK
jgi:hypothetical protein